MTNDPIVVDEWAAARKSEGTTLYGFDTKFWTFDEKGTYFSDTYPRQWSDLALLQIADQKHVLLIQVLLNRFLYSTTSLQYSVTEYLSL